MDANSEMTSQDEPLSTAHGHPDFGLVNEHAAACVMCSRMFAPDNDDRETVTVCGDCKFLLLEDLGDSTHNSLRRRRHRGRSTRYSSSESIENVFSQQISHMINMVRHNHSTVSGHENQSIDGDSSVRLLQHASSRTTPTRSRWRRVFSDSESEGYGNLDSPYGENGTTASASWYRAYHGESDAISFSTYVGDSDISVDGHSVLDMEILNQQDEGSNLDSDTDIDPMNAALDQWNSDDEEEEEEEGEEEEDDDDDDDDEWEEADVEDYTVDSADAGPPLLQDLSISSPYERNGSITRRRLFDSPESEGLIHWRIRHGRQTYNRSIFNNSEESEFTYYVGNSGDYLDARGFEELLEHLADADSSRRGAPPTSVSFVKSLPRVIINEERGNHDGLACAICKDVLSVGTEVNKLPCLHLYHPSCILPWLRTRNSCPLCRFELPTDDRDYEEGKRSSSNRLRIHEIQQQYPNEDGLSDGLDGAEASEAHELVQGGTTEGGELIDVDPGVSNSGREARRRGWFLLAAAPIVSIVGIVLVLWLGNSQGRGRTQNYDLPERGLHQSHVPIPGRNERADRSRRWWSLF